MPTKQKKTKKIFKQKNIQNPSTTDRVKNSQTVNSPVEGSNLIEKLTPAIYQTTTQPIIITDTPSLTEATERLSQLNKYSDALTKDREAITKPLNESLKAIRAKYKPTETLLEQAITSIRQEMGKYQTKVIQEQKAKEQKIADRITSGNLKLETGLKKIEALPEVITSANTANGAISFRTVKKFRIINVKRIPRDLMIPDEKAIEAQMKAGYAVEGVEYYEEQLPINKRT